MSEPGAGVPQDVDDFLASHSRTFLLTLRPDGSPTAHPMTGLYNNGALSFSTYRKSAKTRNVQRDPRAACLVTTTHDDPDFQAVVFRGPARVLESQEMPQRRRPTGDTPSVSSGTASRATKRLKSGKRIILEVAPELVGFLDDLRKA
ncbi:MAG: pyridoxamine 5'-phosphate oxidase family protein [Dehalococcoidia bacterium]